MPAIRETRGYISLGGASIKKLATDSIAILMDEMPDLETQATPFHITLITKDEIESLSPAALATVAKLTTTTAAEVGPFYALGTASFKKSNNAIVFIVIVWAGGQQMRKLLGLPPKDFHITLSAHDDHGVDKSITCLPAAQFDVKNMPLECLDYLTFTLHSSRKYSVAKEFAVEMLLKDSQSSKGWLRLGDATSQLEEYKISMLAYAQAWEKSDNDKLSAYTLKMVHKCAKETEWGQLLQESEQRQLDSVAESIKPLLLTHWSGALTEAVAEVAVSPSLCLEPRERLKVPGNQGFVTLPRYFRWLVPFKIAVMSTPRSAEDIQMLGSRAVGVRTVLTLTEEEPLEKPWFNAQIKNVFLPIRNYYPPSIEQMDIAMRILTDVNSLPVLIHCGGGKGRAGTVAACYMAACGLGNPAIQQSAYWQPAMPAQEAISQLRAFRPGSIETEHQEAFVSKWVSTLWKRQSLFPTPLPEPPSCSLAIDGHLDPAIDLLMMVGIPGSGKSWTAKSLLSRDPRWTYISQDGSGRAACENAVSRSKGKLILDRCSTSPSDRKFWLQLADAKNPVCIHFDYPTELCIYRAQQRADHPTLPPGSRVLNAVKQMTEQFSPPILKEGFKAVLTVRSFAASDALVARLSSTINLLKFPRTPHLLDLGAIGSDDVLLPAAPSPPAGSIVLITEKVDGANMGFSLSAERSLQVQNRSHYVNSSTHAQFKKLDAWIARHREALYAILGRDEFFPQRYILYGEWMFAVHSIVYSTLPDRFLAFDLFDRREGRFVDRGALEVLLEGKGICAVKIMERRITVPTEAELRAMVERPSAFADGRVEGVVVKIELDGWVKWRGKVVRGDFLAGNQHWSKNIPQENGLSVTEMERLGGGG